MQITEHGCELGCRGNTAQNGKKVKRKNKDKK